MSSNQNNSSQKRVKSIRRRLASKIIGAKIGIYIWHDFLLLIALIAMWFMLVEAINIGEVNFKNYNRRIIANKNIDIEKEIRTANGYNEVMNVLDGLLVYEVKDNSTGKIIVRENYFRVFVGIVTIIVGLFVVQLFFSLISIPAANRDVRKILRPLDELAIKADELARFDLSEDKYQIIEEKISNLEPASEDKISLGDEDLIGIENAMNSLIARIKESNRQQARFVNDASHELRTPIAVIQGYANMLSRWGREDEQVLDESITAIKNESDNMQHLVEQLLFLARGDAGRTALNKENININNVMREVYEESLMIDENHIYKLICPDEDIYVMADEGMLKQAVRILTDNAAKYTNEKDEIILSSGMKDGRAFLQVQDSGIGMKDADVEHMFERFYRADEARSYNGTGLGLSIAKWIVDKHNGYFEIVSRQALGTRISIFL